MEAVEFHDLLQRAFDETIKKVLPHATYETSRNGWRIYFSMTVNGHSDFRIETSMPFTHLDFLGAWTHMAEGYDDEPDDYVEVFPEQVSELLHVIADYYSGKLELSGARTRILKRPCLILTDLDTGRARVFYRSSSA